ncbi:MAG TPA: acyl-CoA carboxylase subunit epsilon [Streptosporangiaceae bacterium]|jgi:hypothetical protein
MTETGPELSFASGNPTEEEIAAVVTVVLARTAPASAPGEPGIMRSEWASKSRLMRQPLARGPGGWRASARPC